MEASSPCHNLCPSHHPVFMFIQIVRGGRICQVYSGLL